MNLLSVIVATILMVGLGTCSVKAQTPITSQNILTPSVGAWSGSVTGQAGGFSGGGQGPAYNTLTDTLIFGFTNATATQRINAEAFAIQQALDLSNSGIKINGYNYSWKINNSGDNIGTLTGKVEMLRGGNALESYTYNYSTPTQGFELKTGTQTFTNPQSLLAADQIALSFTGKDARFWAGYYGPQVREPSLTLNYTTDPCMSNPAYSPSCAGYNNILTSQRMYAESYAINQALDLVGAGLKIHGLNYGYDYVLGGTWCSVAGTNADGTLGCSRTDPSSIAVGVAVTKSDGSLLYSNSHYHEEQNSSGSIRNSHVFNNSLLLGDMGGYAMVDNVYGTGAVFNKFSSWKYTPDPCVVNPLSSPSCSGYAAAYQAQMCSANPLYNSACPGYAEALFIQQCTANPLSNPSCPGYAPAYLAYQCSINPLYSTTCPGYEQANLNAQCILDSLYSNKCEGYATAYAIKYLVKGIDSTVINQSLSDTAAVKANDPTTIKVATNTASTTINTDGSVSTGVSATGDTNVDKAIAAKSSTSGNQPAAAVQLTPNTAGAAVAERRQEQKQDDKKAENKPEGGQPPQGAPQGGQQEQKSDQPKTARQELQERRQEAAKAKAVEQGKDLANNMGKAADMEQQKQIQNVVIQAMAFTPGFDAYKVMMPDVAGYKPYSVYGNQKTVDNRRLGYGLFGSTDNLHREMVDSQYNRGK